MRAYIDPRNISNIIHPHYNGPAPYWSWSPGRGWAALFDPAWWAIYVLDRPYISYQVAAAYLAGIVIFQRLMANRKPFDLKWHLVAWNTCHSLFSLMALLHFWPYTIHTISNRGITAYLCDFPPYRRREFLALVTAVIWSRVFEFGDTLFLILRKRKVIHLHWIHHSVVILTLSHFIGNPPAFLIMAATVNLSIHFVMYGYYAVRAAGVPVPIWVAQAITRSQIIQMFFGLIVGPWILYITDWSDRPCHCEPYEVYLGMAVAMFFAVLFINFFVRTYLANTEKKPVDLSRAGTSASIAQTKT